MSGVTTALSLRRLAQESPVLTLMRQTLMPVIAAELSEHLGGDDHAVPAADLYELIDDDLDQLRRAGFDLPRSAQGYCADWVRAGFLVRHPAPQGRGEVFEMSPAGHEAIRFLERLTEPRPAATESRLTMISTELRRLAADTDPEVSSRLTALRAERDRIDQRIQATRRGEFEPLDTAAAAERLQEILAQARDVPADFARVRDSMDSLNRNLRRELIEDEESQGSVLDDIFIGVDRLHDSPEGRSFDAFYRLVMDPEADALFTDSVDQLHSRAFTPDVGSDQLAFLDGFLERLQRESLDVNRSMGLLSRSLRQFVQSRQFEMFREMADRLRAAERAAVEAASTGALRPIDHMEWQLELTTPELKSVGRWVPHVPSEVSAPVDVATHGADRVDWEVLRDQVRASEIDFAELRGDVAETLRAIGPATVADILARHPATQGLASVVGLYVLGTRAGVATARPQTVTWSDATGAVSTTARLSSTYTFQELPDEWV
jgi:hypothetical protein